MPLPETWTTTVTELMFVFRDSLRALVPCAERLKMPWRDAEAYDDWDNIAEALYRNMVINSIEYWAWTTADATLVVPNYDLRYPTYADKSFIEVAQPVPDPGFYHIFLAFRTVEDPFDTVSYQVSGEDLAIAAVLCESPAESAEFRFVWRKESGERQRVSSLTVEL